MTEIKLKHLSLYVKTVHIIENIIIYKQNCQRSDQHQLKGLGHKKTNVTDLLVMLKQSNI